MKFVIYVTFSFLYTNIQLFTKIHKNTIVNMKQQNIR